MKKLKTLLDEFSGVTPLFPLPDFVFFPKTVQPFHIFEPRYLEMIRDVHAGEGLLTIPLIKPGTEADERPEFFEIATLGHLHQVQSLEDGTRNILVTGLVKASIAEVDSDHAYRRGAITPLAEFGQVADAKGKTQSLLRMFQAVLERSSATHNLEILSDGHMPVEMVAHMIIAALPIEVAEKQKMLELQSLDLRINILNNFLESGLSTLADIGKFDPIIPSNPLWN